MMQGIFFAMAFGISQIGVILAREKFRRGVKSLEEENPLAFIAPDVDKFRHSFQISLPKCGVVMPVKGVHGQSYANWRAQVTSMYGGALEFFFVVESEDDPAYPHIERLKRENPEFKIRLLVAGMSWHCSQKIHNQLHGFQRAMHTCHYVIVIDDDIQLHPGTIRNWVEAMEDTNVIAASGYAFDWVPPSVTSFPPYIWFIWRMVATCGFNHPDDRPAMCWGGAMMFRSVELRQNIYGLTDAWRDGGYSEDFITLSLTRHHGRSLAVPKAALFPNELGEVTWGKFWNFLCRQVYVLTQTYATASQRYIAIGAISVNCVMSSSITLGVTWSLLLLLQLLWRSLAAVLTPAFSAPVLGEDDQCALPLAGVGLIALTLLGNGALIKLGAYTYSSLCNILSPELPAIDISHMPIYKISAAIVAFSAMVPAAVVRTLCSRAIIWSGVRFTVENGRVAKMERQDARSEWYSVPREKTLELALRDMAELQIDSSGLLRR